MKEEFDFESIKNKAIEQLKAGKPLLLSLIHIFEYDGLYAQFAGYKAGSEILHQLLLRSQLFIYISVSYTHLY